MAQREINCQDVSARMMELLYGELSGDDRVTIEAHLAGCASCAAELATFQSTRVASRRALDADEAPVRAHQTILRAAAAAVAANQSKPIEARVAAPRPSFWGRWRARWTLPTFATLGAVAVVVLASKVFLEPAKTVELGRRSLQSAPAEAPTAPPVVAEPQATARQATAGEEERAKRLRSTPADRNRKDDAAERLRPSMANDAPTPSLAAPSATQRRRAAPADGFGAPPARPKQARREFAPPPPPLAEPARPSASDANQMRQRDSEGDVLEETETSPRGSVGHVAAGASAAPPPAPKAKKMDMPSKMTSEMNHLDRGSGAVSASAPAPVQPPPTAPASVADKADARPETRAAAKPIAESPVARADRLFAQGQWTAAARAYRDLIRRDPKSGDAARWRQRLAASEEAASAQAPVTPSPGR